MKTTFLSQPEPIVPDTSRLVSSKRGDKGNDGFDATLERQKANSDQTGTRRRLHQSSEESRDGGDPRPMRSDARLSHRLKEIVSRSGKDDADSPADGTQQLEDETETTSAVIDPNSNIPGSAAGSIAILHARENSETQAQSGMPDFSQESTPASRERSNPTIVESLADAFDDTDGVINETVATTPVAVREQQTHFVKDPRKRLDVAGEGKAQNPTLNGEVQPANDRAVAQRDALARTTAAKADAKSVGVEGKAMVGAGQDEAAEPSSPTMQILSKIVDNLADDGAPAAAPAASAQWQSNERPFGALLRVIRLELAPASLGVVHVTLKGANTALNVSIAAEMQQTAASLGADRAALSSRLHESGYTIDDIVVTTLDRSLDVTSTQRTDQPSGTSSNQLAAGTNDASKRQADDGYRRPQSQSGPSLSGENRGGKADHDNAEAASPRSPTTAWRGRHATRSV